MRKKFRYTVTIDGIKKCFVTVKQTRQGDLIIAQRGRRHEVPIAPAAATSIDYSITDENIVTHDATTIHPNPQSEIASITVNRHQHIDGVVHPPYVSYLLDVRNGPRLIPIYGSIGRNLTSANLNFDARSLDSAEEVELWPGQSIESHRNSICYLIGVANRHVQFMIPEDFPRNFEPRFTSNFQVIFFYWLFNQPIKLRGSSSALAGTQEFGPQPQLGLELHEVLNLTNDLTLAHARNYRSFPDLPPAVKG